MEILHISKICPVTIKTEPTRRKQKTSVEQLRLISKDWSKLNTPNNVNPNADAGAIAFKPMPNTLLHEVINSEGRQDQNRN